MLTKYFYSSVLSLFAAISIFCSCTEKYLGDPHSQGHFYTATFDSLNDLGHKLTDAGHFSTLLAAMKQLKIDTLLSSPYGKYTLFAPTDSAFAAGGLTLSTLNSLSPDSLNHLIRYHIVQGLITDSSLLSSHNYVIAGSLRRFPIIQSIGGTTTSIINGYYLYLYKRKDGLRITGKKVNHGESGIFASNGYIHPIHVLVKPPDSSMYQILTNRPEYSDFIAASKLSIDIYGTRGDGINQIKNSYNSSNIVFGPVSLIGVPVQTSFLGTTIFAPTNKAFQSANYLNQTTDITTSLKAFQKQYKTIYKDNQGNRYTLDPIDSAILGHFLSGQTVFYSDLFQAGLNYNQTLLYAQTQFNHGFFPTPNRDLGILNYYPISDSIRISWVTISPVVEIPASITNPDIIAYDGIIHGVNRLFSPNH